MKRLKKILCFVLGWQIVPLIFALINVWIWQIDSFKIFYCYFSIVYLLCYISFPLFYRPNIAKKIPNKYAFYGIMYGIFWIFGILLCLV